MAIPTQGDVDKKMAEPLVRQNEPEIQASVPWAIANAAYKKQKRNKGVTEIVKMPDRGHTLTIDAGWREVAEKALEFVKRFTSRPADQS